MSLVGFQWMKRCIPWSLTETETSTSKRFDGGYDWTDRLGYCWDIWIDSMEHFCVVFAPKFVAWYVFMCFFRFQYDQILKWKLDLQHRFSDIPIFDLWPLNPRYCPIATRGERGASPMSRGSIERKLIGFHKTHFPSINPMKSMKASFDGWTSWEGVILRLHEKWLLSY